MNAGGSLVERVGRPCAPVLVERQTRRSRQGRRPEAAIEQAVPSIALKVISLRQAQETRPGVESGMRWLVEESAKRLEPGRVAPGTTGGSASGVSAQNLNRVSPTGQCVCRAGRSW